MPPFAPNSRLETHEVTNQSTELVDRNLYAIDAPLREAVLREAGEWLDGPLMALGNDVGSERVLELGMLANRFPPELVTFDRYGRRIDEVRFHPAYHELMTLAMDHGIHDRAWQTMQPGRHLAHAAMLAVFTQAEAGAMCPINMSYAVVPALRTDTSVSEPWLRKLLGGRYEARLAPIDSKRSSPWAWR